MRQQTSLHYVDAVARTCHPKGMMMKTSRACSRRSIRLGQLGSAKYTLRALAVPPDQASLAVFVQDVNRGPGGEERAFRVVSTGRTNGDIDELSPVGVDPAAVSALRLRFDGATS